MEGFYFDIGLDPNFRLAQSADALSQEKTMLRLSNFKKHRGINAEFDAKIIDAIHSVANTGNSGYDIGAAVLRDCYGKVNYFFAPSDLSGFEDLAKLFKAYKKDIRVVSVSVGDQKSDSVSAYADTFIHVPHDAAAAAADELQTLENLQVDTVSGGVLQAAADEAKKNNDKHARYVVLLARR